MQNKDLHEPTGAIAYTREHWTLTYADGGQTEMDVINAYELKWLGEYGRLTRPRSLANGGGRALSRGGWLPLSLPSNGRALFLEKWGHRRDER